MLGQYGNLSLTFMYRCSHGTYVLRLPFRIQKSYQFKLALYVYWLDSYAPELVPIFYYRYKTRVRMFDFLSNIVSKFHLIHKLLCVYAHI